MIGILLVVVILGILATIVLAVQGSTSPKGTNGAASQGTTTTAPQSVGSAAQESAISACEADYQTVNSALQTYRTLKGTEPAAGSAWATAGAGGALLASWPTDPQYFTITWDGTQLSVIPAKGTASHGSVGTSTPPTGCFAA
jgi:type II secretory pathway pseudopilin PulG